MIGGVLYDKEWENLWLSLCKGSVGVDPTSFKVHKVFLSRGGVYLEPEESDHIKIPEEFC